MRLEYLLLISSLNSATRTAHDMTSSVKREKYRRKKLLRNVSKHRRTHNSPWPGIRPTSFEINGIFFAWMKRIFDYQTEFTVEYYGEPLGKEFFHRSRIPWSFWVPRSLWLKNTKIVSRVYSEAEYPSISQSLGLSVIHHMKASSLASTA